MEFIVSFNFTVSKIGPDQLGYGYGIKRTIQLRPSLLLPTSPKH